MTRRIFIAAILLMHISTVALYAEDWTNTKRACQDWQKEPKQYHSLEECVIDFFTLQPFAVTAGNIGSGSSLALGARFLEQFNPHGLETTFTAKGCASAPGFACAKQWPHAAS